MDFPTRTTSTPRGAGSRSTKSIRPSRIVIEVRRGGTLAQLGHDHVVVSHDVAGYVAPAEGRADLYVRLDRLVVDEPRSAPKRTSTASRRTTPSRERARTCCASSTPRRTRSPSSACAAWTATRPARGSMRRSRSTEPRARSGFPPDRGDGIGSDVTGKIACSRRASASRPIRSSPARCRCRTSRHPLPDFTRSACRCDRPVHRNRSSG